MSTRITAPDAAIMANFLPKIFLAQRMRSARSQAGFLSHVGSLHTDVIPAAGEGLMFRE